MSRTLAAAAGSEETNCANQREGARRWAAKCEAEEAKREAEEDDP